MFFLKKNIYLFVFICLFSFPVLGYAQSDARWDAWIRDLKQDVVAKGIKPDLASRVLDNLSFDPKVIERDSNQAPKRFTFSEYKTKAVNPGRVKNGRNFYRRHREELKLYASQYNVPPEVIVALLGIETDYGNYTGKFNIVRSIASLAYGAKRDKPSAQKSRRAYFRKQTYYALRMIQDGITDEHNFKGSWAGAFGINQHMPESFYDYVIDGDKDGDLEIMNMDDLSDVFATTASHLAEVGWKPGQRWGREVRLPQHFSKNLIGNKIKKPLKFWKDLGVTLPDGQPIPVVAGMQGSIIAPDGVAGPVYIGYDNFHAFRRWNRSDYFALVVGSLSDRIASR